MYSGAYTISARTRTQMENKEQPVARIRYIRLDRSSASAAGRRPMFEVPRPARHTPPQINQADFQESSPLVENIVF